MRLVSVVIASGALWAGVSASAAEPKMERLVVRLGLWETTRTTASSGAPAGDTGSLSPDQKAALDALNKKNAEEEPLTSVTQSCMTAESLAKDPFQDKDHPGTDCVRTVIGSSPTLQNVKMVCTGRRPRTAEMRLDVITPQIVKGTLTVTSPGPGGGPAYSVASSWTSKWLGAKCGEVK